MTSRRELLSRAAGAAAGLAFTACGVHRAALAQGPGAQGPGAQGPGAQRPGAQTPATPGAAAHRRREVVVSGKRVRTVDVHAHCHIPEALALVGKKVQFPGLVVAPKRIELMDEQGIDIEALSINPNFWDKEERDLQAQIVKLQNEKLAEICGQHPDRFVGLASLALAHPDLAVAQLEDGARRLGLRGALIGGSVNGVELSDPKLHPFWSKAEELGVLIFIHPQGTPELEASGRLKGNGALANVIGNPLETTIALSHLIFEGTLDKFPGVKICGAHAGGYLPSYAGRSDAICENRPKECKVSLKKKPSEYLRQLYYDSLVFTPEGLRHLAAEVGAGQIVMGTDYPFPWTTTSVDHILDTPGFSDAERAAMLGGTAARLLNIKT